MNNYKKQYYEINSDEQQRDMLTRQLAMIREVETLGTAMSSHPLNTLSQRYHTYKITLDEFNHIKQILYDKQKDYEINYQSYYNIISKSNDIIIRELQYELDEMTTIQINNEFDLIKEFLDNNQQYNNNNSLNMYTEADQARKELNVSFMQQSLIIKVAIDTLSQYLNIIQFYPRSLIQKHRYVCYMNWCKQLLENPDSYQNIVEEFKLMLNNDTLIDAIAERAIQYAFELNKLWIEMDYNLRKSYDILKNETPEYNVSINYI